MAKRFTDTELWQKEWFLRLPELQRCLFLYIKDNCDCAGVYEANYLMLEFIFQKKITKEDILMINETKNQIEFLDGNKFFLTDFCSFQYGKLKQSCKPHLKVIETLKKHNLFERVSKGYVYPLDTLEEKEEEKEEDKEEEKEEDGKGGMGEKPNFTNPDFYTSQETNEAFKIYEENCPNLIPLTGEKKNKRIMDKLYNVLNALDNAAARFKELCIKANEIVTIAATKIDFEMMLNCYIGILNGKYPTNSDQADDTQARGNSVLEELKRKRGLNSG